MGLLLRTFIKAPQNKQQPIQWVFCRSYSAKSDITASAMVYTEYGQPSQVLK
jgi:hypothetical protein